MVVGAVDPTVMRRNVPDRTHRRTTTHRRYAPLPGREPRRTTPGLVAAVLVPAAVVAAAFAPVTTAAVAAVALTVGVAVTAAARTRDATGGRHDPGDCSDGPGVTADCAG